MSYPAAAGQGLYESSTTAKHPLGTVAQFTDANGALIEARYMSNGAGATVAAGKVVAHGDTLGKFITVYASNAHHMGLAGGLAASCDTTGYGWVIFKGRQTNASMATSYASVAGWRVLRANGSAALVSNVTTTAWPAYATANANLCAFIENGTSANTGAGGNVIWRWR